MDEQEYEQCLKIHGYRSSEEESDSESNRELDETYQRYKPPPIQIDVEKHHIIEIGVCINHSNEGLSKSQRKRKRKRKKETGGSSAVVKDVSGDNADNSIATDKIIYDNFVHTNKFKSTDKTKKNTFMIPSEQGNSTKKKKNKNVSVSTNTKLVKINKKLESENKGTKDNLMVPPRQETTTKKTETDPLCGFEQTYADVLKSTKVRQNNVPVSRLANHVQHLYDSTESLTKKEKRTMRKTLWKTYRKSMSFGDIIDLKSWDEENQKPLTFGDFIEVKCSF